MRNPAAEEGEGHKARMDIKDPFFCKICFGWR